MVASRNKFVEKSGMPDRVESLGKVDRSENRPRARLGFDKTIGNGRRRIKNLMESGPSMAETCLAGRENRVMTSNRKINAIE